MKDYSRCRNSMWFVHQGLGHSFVSPLLMTIVHGLPLGRGSNDPRYIGSYSLEISALKPTYENFDLALNELSGEDQMIFSRWLEVIADTKAESEEEAARVLVKTLEDFDSRPEEEQESILNSVKKVVEKAKHDKSVKRYAKGPRALVVEVESSETRFMEEGSTAHDAFLEAKRDRESPGYKKPTFQKAGEGRLVASGNLLESILYGMLMEAVVVPDIHQAVDEWLVGHGVVGCKF